MFKKINLKHRHILTPNGNIRLRHIVAIIVFILLIISFIPSGERIPSYDIDVNNEVATVVETEDKSDEIIRDVGYDPEQSGNGIGPFLTRIGARPYFNKPYNYVSEIKVKSGDVLSTLIEETGLQGPDYSGVMAAIKKHVDPRDIKPGHKILVTYEKFKNNTNIINLSYVYDSLTSIKVSKNDGVWGGEKTDRPLTLKTRANYTKVENSLYGSMAKSGIPDGIINRMIKAYSWTVDFQRDIWGGEEIEVLYETKETDDGEYVRSNRLLYANLKLRGRDLPIYLYEKDKGFPNYFEPSGQSIRRALMKTPIDGARLSSGYGMRTHPVLGYKKAHKGVDFAAPTGTPIYAAGDGVVQRANRFSSYGNYIKIKHNKTFQTAYAHLNGFAKGIRAGARVKQGQVIGYVGTTGRSTGPHLHYEVHKNGVKVNPHSVDLPLGEQLKGEKREQFRTMMRERNKMYESITGVAPGQNSNVVKPLPKPKI